MSKHTPVPQNFIYPKIPKTAFKFGSSQVVGVPLRPDGDWRPYVPPEEEQRRHGVESSACYVEGQQHTIATLQEEQFGLPDNNYSARFNALLSDGTPNGGDPIAAAQSFRHDGLIPDEMLPFNDVIASWDEFHSFGGADESACRAAGKKWLEIWEPKYDIVFERDESVQDKYIKLREALKYSPVPISVYAWMEENGEYIKPDGASDNHLVECVYLDENDQAYIWDTYPPFLKKLKQGFNFDFAMRWSLNKIEPIAGGAIKPLKRSFWARLWYYLIGRQNMV